jgi:CRP/FNR family nitrogen fixation transcriptional regulator
MLMQTPRSAFAASQPAAPSPMADLFDAFNLMGSRMTLDSNEEIFGEKEPAEYVYKVVSGAVRTYTILNDGRRQIGAFYLPGEIFGLEVDNEHQLSAEAICNTVVRVVRRSAVMSLAERDGEVARALWSLTARALYRAQEHVMLLIKSAQQRVACFLLEMSDRIAATDTVELPMSRQDIADYLGLTIETVSRTMSQLASESAIGLPSARRIVLRNRRALTALNA